jgi:hypothetical protein
VHPTEGEAAHEVYFMCADAAAVVERLKERGIETEQPIQDRGCGRHAPPLSQ